jgi:peptidyl-prolyl cis-trans isomerase SurA
MKSLLVSLSVAALFSLSARSQSDLLNGIAVIVNDTVITFRDVQSFIAGEAELQYRLYRDPKVLEQKLIALRRDGIETLVERQLILDEFKSAGYPEALLEDAVEKAVKDDIRQNFGNSRLTLTKTIAERGLTYERYKQQIKERIIVGAMSSKNVSEEVVVSPHKIENYYQQHQDQFKLEDQVKLRMIVLNKPRSGSPAAARKLAEEILAKLDEGAAFAEMATIYSEGSQRGQGGDWGWYERGKLRKELAEVAGQLPKGAHSKVIETDEALFIMLVEDVQPAHVKPLSEVRDEIEKTLITQERTRLRKKWIDKLKAKAFLKYF